LLSLGKFEVLRDLLQQVGLKTSEKETGESSDDEDEAVDDIAPCKFLIFAQHRYISASFLLLGESINK